MDIFCNFAMELLQNLKKRRNIMAKKKNKKKAQSQQFMSPEKFLKERMRSVPIGKCYITKGYEKSGYGNIIVSREHTGGRISFAIYMVDFWCLGVKDSFYKLRVEAYEFLQTVYDMTERLMGIQEISYEGAHNLIYGAVAFAEEAGIAPCKEFALGQYFLEEDTEDIPLIEYEFGKEGKHWLVAKDQLELSTYLPTLQKNLSEDQYHYTVGVDDEEDMDDDWDDDWNDEDDWDDEEDFDEDEEEMINSDFYRYNAYPYTYRFKNLPSSLELKHPRILEILQKKENWLVIPKEQLAEILSLPHEEVRQDLEQIILYGIHEMVSEDGEFDENAAESYGFPLAHSVMLLAEVGNDTSSLNAVLETLRMPDEAIDWVYGDGMDMTVEPTIVKLAPHAIDTLVAFLLEEGLVNSRKSYVMTALVNIEHYYPETHDEVVAAFRTFIKHALEDKQEALYTSYTLNGLLVCALLDLHEKDLWPEIEKMYKLNLVELMCAGKLKEVKRDLLFRPSAFSPCDIDIEERYKSMDRAFGHNRRD